MGRVCEGLSRQLEPESARCPRSRLTPQLQEWRDRVESDEEEGGESVDGPDDRLCCSILLQDDLRVRRARNSFGDCGVLLLACCPGISHARRRGGMRA